MRKIIVASAIAFAASLSMGAAANAASVTVKTGPMMHHHRHVRHCMTKRVVHHYHGKTVVRRERVCR